MSVNNQKKLEVTNLNFYCILFITNEWVGEKCEISKIYQKRVNKYSLLKSRNRSGGYPRLFFL